MVAIQEDEIRPGLVVYIDQPMLGLDDRVLKTGTVGSATDARLCVCYAIDGDTSDWSPITTEPKRERLPIKDEWRSGGNRECSGGYAQWLLDDQYLQDGANTYHGPNAAFVAASWQECTALDTRARVSGEGMALVDQEIAAQRRRR